METCPTWRWLHPMTRSVRHVTLAAQLALLGGLLLVSGIVAARRLVDGPTVPLSACGIYLATVVLLLWLGRERPRTLRNGASVFQFLRRRKHSDYMPHYKPRRREHRVNQVFGTNEPPTVETVRALSDNMGNWVPSDRNLKK